MLRTVAVLVVLGIAGAASSTAHASAPPALRFVAKPAAVTEATTATFVVRAPHGARLRCQLDAHVPRRCGRRTVLKGLKTGRHRFVVRGTWHGHRLKSASYRWSVVVFTGAPGTDTPTGTAPQPGTSTSPSTGGSGPTLVAPPVVTGTPAAGSTLTAQPGTWSGATGVTRRWQRCDATGANCVELSGRTGTTYAVMTIDMGHTLRVVETATNAAGSRDAASAPSAVVAKPPVNTVRPSISGTPKVGSTLQGDAGTWSGSDLTFSYQWVRCAYNVGAGCTNIAGATSLTYTPVADDVTQSLVLVVVATNSSGSAPAASGAVGPVVS